MRCFITPPPPPASQYMRQIHKSTSLTSSSLTCETQLSHCPNADFMKELKFFLFATEKIHSILPATQSIIIVPASMTCGAELLAFFCTSSVHLVSAGSKCLPIYTPLLDFTFPKYDHPESTAHTTHTLSSQFIT